jgi:HEAT repeat protein
MQKGAHRSVSIKEISMNKEELSGLAETDPSKTVDAAIEAMKRSDRNVRVAALRILGRGHGEKAANGIIAGLNDPKRRVREVAVKSSRPYLDDPRVVARLQEMIEDDNETDRIRGQALQALAGHFPHQPDAPQVPQAAIRALELMAKAEKYRSAVLWRLLQMDLTEEVENLLREFVKEGTREQAVMATRALCGYRVVNIGVFDKEERRRIVQTSEVAAGRVFYWVERSRA